MALLTQLSLSDTGLSFSSAYCKVTSFRWDGGSGLRIGVSMWISEEAKNQEKDPIKRIVVDMPFDLTAEEPNAALPIYNSLRAEIYNYLKANFFPDGVDA